MPPISVLRRHLGGLERSIDELRLRVKDVSSNISDLSEVSRSLMTKCSPGESSSVNVLDYMLLLSSSSVLPWWWLVAENACWGVWEMVVVEG